MFNKVISVDEKNSDSRMWDRRYGFRVLEQYLNQCAAKTIEPNAEWFPCKDEKGKEYKQSVEQMKLYVMTLGKGDISLNSKSNEWTMETGIYVLSCYLKRLESGEISSESRYFICSDRESYKIYIQDVCQLKLWIGGFEISVSLGKAKKPDRYIALKQDYDIAIGAVTSWSRTGGVR